MRHLAPLVPSSMIVGGTWVSRRKGGWLIPSGQRRAGLPELPAEGTAYPAGWLYDRLADRYGDGQVVKDVDSFQLGDDFGEQHQQAP